MLQRTKKGHKLEDQWLGPYTISALNAEKGVCRLTNSNGKQLANQVNIKQLKPYLATTGPDASFPASTIPQQQPSVPGNPPSSPASCIPQQPPPMSGRPTASPASTIPPHQTPMSGRPTASPASTKPQQPPPMSGRPTASPASTKPQQPPPMSGRPTVSPASTIPQQQPSLPGRPTMSSASTIPQQQSSVSGRPTSSQASTIPPQQPPMPGRPFPPHASTIPQQQLPVPGIPTSSQASTIPTQQTPMPDRSFPPPASTRPQQHLPVPGRTPPSPTSTSASNIPHKPSSLPGITNSSATITSDKPSGVSAKSGKVDIQSAMTVETTYSDSDSDNMHSCEDTLAYGNIIKSVDENDINQLFSKVKKELDDILCGRIKSWRLDLYKTGKSDAAPGLKRQDLPFNVKLGEYTDEQHDIIIDQLQINFKATETDCILKVLLPEVVVRITREALKISLDEAIQYLATGHLEKCHSQKRESPKESDQTNVPKSKKAKLSEDCIITGTNKMSMKSQQHMIYQTYHSHEHLSEQELEKILRNQLLNDLHMGKAQSILASQFPHINGQQPPTLGRLNQFDIRKGEFIQILHTGSLHWLCVSNLGVNETNVVNIYDSMYSRVKPFVKKQIASILHVDTSDEIILKIQPVNQQTNLFDCGVYSIGFAVALCNGIDPVSLKFNRRSIRQHLWLCLKNERMEMFPTTTKYKSLSSCTGEPKQIVKVRIYCTCRLPYTHGDGMVECVSCFRWYHKDCQQVPDRVFRRKHMLWKCSFCVPH